MSMEEYLVSSLQSQIAKLEQELAEAQQDILDFEVAAKEWKKGYEDMEHSYRVKLKNAQQIIEELQDELSESKFKSQEF